MQFCTTNIEKCINLSGKRILPSTFSKWITLGNSLGYIGWMTIKGIKKKKPVLVHVSAVLVHVRFSWVFWPQSFGFMLQHKQYTSTEHTLINNISQKWATNVFSLFCRSAINESFIWCRQGFGYKCKVLLNKADKSKMANQNKIQ